MWAPDRWPAWVTVPLLVFVVVIAVIRVTLVRGSRTIDRLINVTLSTFAVSSLIPTIADDAARFVPGGLPTLYALNRGMGMMGWACGLGILLLYKYGPIRYRIRFQIVLGLSATLFVIFQFLTAPAEAQGMPIAEYGGWRQAVNAGIYTALQVVLGCYLVHTGVTMWRHTKVLRERMIVATLLVFAAVYALPAVGVVFLVILGAVNDDFTHRAESLTSGSLATREPGLLFVTVATLAFARSPTRAVAQLLRLDRESRTARRLYPLWRDLTAAAPQVVFPLKRTDRRNTSPKERAHRRRVEIHDAAQIVARFVAPLPIIVDELIETTVPENDHEHMRVIVELVMAAQRLAGRDGTETAGEPVEHGTDPPNEQTLLRFWEPAKSLLRTANKTPPAAVS